MRERSASITRYLTGERQEEGDPQKIRAVIVEDKEKLIKALEELSAERLSINKLQEAANDAREGMLSFLCGC